MSLCLSSGEYPEAATRGAFCKKSVFRNFKIQNSQEIKIPAVPESLF